MRIRKYRTLQYLPQTRGSHHTSDAVCRKQGNQGKPGNQETGEKPGTVTGNQGNQGKPGKTRETSETRDNEGQRGTDNEGRTTRDGQRGTVTNYRFAQR